MAKQEEIGLLIRLKDGVTKGIKSINASFKHGFYEAGSFAVYCCFCWRCYRDN